MLSYTDIKPDESIEPGRSSVQSEIIKMMYEVAFQDAGTPEKFWPGTLPPKVVDALPEDARGFVLTNVFLGETRERRLISILEKGKDAPITRGGSDGTRRGGEQEGYKGGTFRGGDRSSDDQNEPIARTPHMDINTHEPVETGSEFQIEIYADQQTSKPGETAKEIFVDIPRNINEISLNVWLVTSQHFEVIQEPAEMLRLEREKPKSNTLVFTLRCRDADTLELLKEELVDQDSGSITACFAHYGQPCGKVSRKVAIKFTNPIEKKIPGGGRTARKMNNPESPALSSQGDMLKIQLSEQMADMIVQIIAEENSTSGHRFQCHITSAFGEASSTWATREPTAALVETLFANFTAAGKGKGQLKAALRGAGIEMFEASPKLFQETFWRLIDHNMPPKTIQIVTDEPNFLWELMIPKRNGEEWEMPLGVEFIIARWVTGYGTSPSQQLQITDSYSIAPEYNRLANLRYASAEAMKVAELFSGKQIMPATYDEIVKKLSEKGPSLLHFACHGDIKGTTQVLLLNHESELTIAELKGEKIFSEYFSKHSHLVFLNACKVGRQQVALSGAGGFPAVMTNLGARAVIAPAWSVKDDIAHNVATRFYEELIENPEKPLAAILQQIRKDAYKNGEDSYAAYCFYGDPFATCKQERTIFRGGRR